MLRRISQKSFSKNSCEMQIEAHLKIIDFYGNK